MSACGAALIDSKEHSFDSQKKIPKFRSMVCGLNGEVHVKHLRIRQVDLLRAQRALISISMQRSVDIEMRKIIYLNTI